MPERNNNDLTAMYIQLNELRSSFDRAMQNGEEFNTIKKMYLQIKELESSIHALEWNPPKSREK